MCACRLLACNIWKQCWIIMRKYWANFSRFHTYLVTIKPINTSPSHVMEVSSLTRGGKSLPSRYHNQLNELSTSAVYRISKTMRYITFSARHQHSVRLSSVCLSVRLSKRDEVTNRQTDRQTEKHWQMLCFVVYRARRWCWAYSIAVWQWRYYVQLINLNNQHYNAE